MIEISLKPEALFTIGGFPFTNAMLSTLVVTLILIIVFSIVAKRMKAVPTTLQLFLEEFVGFTHKFVSGITGQKKLTNMLYPFFATLFAFFLIANLMGLLPGLSAISVNGVTLFRAAASDYALIFALTMTMFICLQIFTLMTAGIIPYIKQFFNPTNPIDFVMGLLNIVGELGKIVSLSFRLFGNIFAGEVIATVMLSLAPYVLPVPFALLGMLSSVIQALIFPLLIVIYFKMGFDVKVGAEKEREEKLAKKQLKTQASLNTAT